VQTWDDRSGRTAFLLSVAFSALALCVPFALTGFPPVTDLPQQSAQIGLLLETLSSGTTPYEVQWLKPNNLSYLLLGFGWAAVGPQNAGRLAMGLIGVFTVAAIHLLARRRRRCLQAASLATLFFFSHTLYWGFLNFSIALPIFLLWIAGILNETSDEPSSTAPTRLLRHSLFALLFYASHVLWLPVALGFLVASDLLRRRRWTRIALRAAPFALFAALAAAWVVGLPSRGFASETIWGDSIGERLLPVWWADAALGGLAGTIEAAFLTTVLLWVAMGIWQHRNELWKRIDGPLIASAGSLLVLSALLPIKFNNVIFLSQRWVPVAAMLLLLALPAPRRDGWLLHAVPALIVAGFSITTASVWLSFERTELKGLETSLARVPARSRLIELDFIKKSERVRSAPFLHASAYAQLRAPVDLNFSFAQHATSLVVFRDRADFPWQRNLVWSAERVRHEDLVHFDYALVHATDRVHSALARQYGLEPLPSEDPWRIYRVPPAAVTVAQ
jgi:hypothetical protein